MKIIVPLNAPPRTGKDETASRIMGLCKGVKIFRFAAYIKDETHKAHGLTNIPFDHYEDVKDMCSPDFDGKTPREAYIHISEKVLKPKYGRDFVANHLVKELEASKHDINIVTDLGFNKEYLALLKMKFPVLLVRLSRDGYTFEHDSRYYVKSVHGRPETMEAHILNDGTLDSLALKVKDSIDRFRNGIIPI